MLSWIFKRRSIRKFTDRLVEQDKTDLLLKAAMAAPSASNRQPWQFIVITRRATLDAIAEIHPYAKMLKEAPLCICVCGENENRYWVQDCSAAMENLLLAAANLDLGGVWLGVHPNQEREAQIAEILALPRELTPLGLAALGYPAEEKPAHTKHNPEKVHYEVYGGISPCPTD